jgi:S-adenosylmethionine:tRNA ribosyltransferase-isomerase
MPSAGRPFTISILARLRERGIEVVPLLLHTGVASVETDERPPEEYYRVSQETADAVNYAQESGRHIIAVGTTVVRALETVTTSGGRVHPGEGWTNLMITPRRRIASVDGLLTGLHEPRSTHLLMLFSLAGMEHIQRSYAEALKKRYLWHEFGDEHLILP